LNKNTILIIGAGKHQTSLIQKVSLLGYKVLAIDIDPNAEGFNYAHEKWICSAYDYSLIIDKIKKENIKEEIVAVLTQAARGCILSVSKISEFLELRYLNCKTAKLSNNKSNLSRKLNPNHFIGTFNDITKISLDKLSYPCVFKWEGTSGGMGVILMKNKGDINKIDDSLLKSDEPILVENFVNGRHFGIVGIVNKKDLKLYGIIEKFHNNDLTLNMTIFPAVIENKIQKKLYEYTKYILEKTNFDFGPFQLEMILDNKENPFFIEIEPSIMGSYISELMIPLTSRNDMIIDSINLACNGNLNTKVYKNYYKAILRYYYPNDTGKLKSMELENADRRVLFKPYFNSGEYIEFKKLYIANTFIIGNDVKKMIKVVNKQRLNINFFDEVN